MRSDQRQLDYAAGKDFEVDSVMLKKTDTRTVKLSSLDNRLLRWPVPSLKPKTAILASDSDLPDMLDSRSLGILFMRSIDLLGSTVCVRLICFLVISNCDPTVIRVRIDRGSSGVRGACFICKLAF